MNKHNQKLSHTQSMGLIWVTGYSAAGKTTVGKFIAENLSNRGYKVIFLDGDKLREIFSNNWGYSRDQRIELARIYFKLCGHLVSQGNIVIISAIAMYEEIRSWVADNFRCSIIALLDVPPEIRRSRDSQTKNVYQKDPNCESLYDQDFSPDVIFNNFDNAEPVKIAKDIVSRYLARCIDFNVDKGRSNHWNSFYKSAISAPLSPSTFAEYVGPQLRPGMKLLEIGSGNGRDSHFFSKIGCHVTAVDPSHEAIDFSINRHNGFDINFICGKIDDIDIAEDNSYDVVYCRFCLHAMTEDEENDLLQRSYSIMKNKGKIFIECRSINDPLALLGEIISPTERIHGHYRRFIVLKELMRKMLEIGFEVLRADEVGNVAAFGDDNPVVIRLVAQK